MGLADGSADSRSQIGEISHLPIPELSRIAWMASSNIDSGRNETRPIYRLPPEALALIIDFCQLEQFEGHPSGAYRWVRLMLVSRMWRATILSFPSLWSKLVLNASISQSEMITLVDRSGSHPLQVAIPRACSKAYRRSDRHKRIELAIKLLPRVSRLTIHTCGKHDRPQVPRMFKGRTADQLLELNLRTPFVEEFVLYAPRLRSLTLPRTESWPPPPSENITHICLFSSLNPESLERGLKNCPRLKEIRIDLVSYLVELPGDHPKISLLPGVRLIITGSVNTMASLFALGPTNYLSITTTFGGYGILDTPYLGFALPRDISRLGNLDDLTMVHLKLTDTGDGGLRRTFTLTLKCSTADREALHVQVDNILAYEDSHPDPTDMEGVPTRAMGYLYPLDLRQVVELRMDGFIEGWVIHSSELSYFLEKMPTLRRITTGDDNAGMFSLALGTMEHNVVIERV